MASFLGQNSLQTFLRPCIIPCYSTPKLLRYTLTYASSSLPARDKVIDFGKYKGRMLGSLPSTYLKWVSNNLRARDFQEWANLADQVLQDPVYNDRIEWEYAEKLLNGDALNTSSNAAAKSEGVVSELLEISQRFGWDNDDKVGWSKVDYQLLGTSKGSRIPRVKARKDEEESMRLKKSDRQRSDHGGSLEVGNRRVERRDRLRMHRGVSKKLNNDRLVEEEDVRSSYRKSCDQNARVYNPFPGRETLLREALNRRRIA